jgi:hypothetical protein
MPSSNDPASHGTASQGTAPSRAASGNTAVPQARRAVRPRHARLRTVTDRRVLRWVHLVPAVLVGTFVYAPWTDVSWFALLIQALAFPLLAGTGLLMWQARRIRRRLAAPALTGEG